VRSAGPDQRMKATWAQRLQLGTWNNVDLVWSRHTLQLLRIPSTSTAHSPSTGRGQMAGQGSTGNVIAALCSFFIPGLGQLLQARLLIAITQYAAWPADTLRARAHSLFCNHLRRRAWRAPRRAA
jgi:hypothetical protein